MSPDSIFTIASLAALVMSIVLHEVAHGYMANWLGDPTARLAGRLTVNPISHIDPIGSVLVPLFLYFTHAGVLFGWAKPVPYNPYNIRNQRWGEALVAIAGPGTNILLALIFALIIRAGFMLGLSQAFYDIAGYIVYINILLACFNMIPLPPLDGSKVLLALLPYQLEMKYRDLIALVERYGFFATLAFIFAFMYFFSPFLTAAIGMIYRIFVGIAL